MSRPICNVCDQSGFGIEFSMTPLAEGYKFGEICTECDTKTVVNTMIDMAAEAKAERQVDALEDNGREYPKGYDGTGAW
jgi:hypothetical protein